MIGRVFVSAVAIMLCSCTASIETGSALLTRDPQGWFTIPVTLNGEGPFPFIVDTGAQRTVISPAVADRLGLSSIPGVEVQGASGNGAGRMAVLQRYKSGLFDRRFELAPVMPAGGAVMTGVVGMSPFVSGRLEMDLANLRVSAGPSTEPPVGFVTVPIRIVQDTFAIADITVDGVPAKAMVDTGSLRSTANPQLQEALGLKANDPRLLPDRPLGGATTDKVAAVKAVLHRISIGPIVFSDPEVRFANAPVFARLGLDNGPAIILGLDQLSKLKALAIDYPHSQLELKN